MIISILAGWFAISILVALVLGRMFAEPRVARQSADFADNAMVTSTTTQSAAQTIASHRRSGVRAAA